jgi:hypothetical protein
MEARVMGDVVMSWNRRSCHWGFASGLGLSLLLAGCGVSGPSTTSAVAPATGVAATPVEDAVRVTGVTLREAAPGMRVDLAASGPVVWTQYRDAGGRLVLELPNAVLDPQVSGFSPAAGLVSEVAIEAVTGDGRPLVRVAIATRFEAEHQLALEGSVLQISLAGSGDVEPQAVASEPLAVAEMAPSQTTSESPSETTPVESSEATAPSGVLAAGTPEQPTTGGATSTATRLAAVSIAGEATAPRVIIAGDGQFAWSAFRLTGPDRLVVDLQGVTNATHSGAIAGSGGAVERVRVAQFRPDPDAIARVVVDFAQPSEARIVETADGLEILVNNAEASIVPYSAELVAEVAPSAPVEEAPAPASAQGRMGVIPRPCGRRPRADAGGGCGGPGFGGRRGRGAGTLGCRAASSRSCPL